MNHLRALPSQPLSRASLALLILAAWSAAQAQEGARLSVIQPSANEICLAIDPATHQRLGAAYPLTFRFSLPTGAGVIVQRKYDWSADWTRLTEKSSGDLYNAVEVVRVDSGASLVYVSVGFAAASDSIFLRFTSGSEAPLGGTISACRNTTMAAGLR